MSVSQMKSSGSGPQLPRVETKVGVKIKESRVALAAVFTLCCHDEAERQTELNVE